MFTKRENEITALFILRWSGRVLSLMVLVLLVLFYLGEGTVEAEIGLREFIGLLFFPIGLAIGYVIAWRRELLGGSVALLSVFAFYTVYGLLLNGSIRQGTAFLVFAIPGLLYAAYGVLSRTWFPQNERKALI